MARAIGRRRKAAKRSRTGRFMEAASTRRKARKLSTGTRKRRRAAAPTANPRRKKRAGARRTTRRTTRRTGARRTAARRKRPGHHKHDVRTHYRKVRGRARRIKIKRHRSHEIVANPRRRVSRKRKRPGHKKHDVKGHYRRVRGSSRRIFIKRHRSHEEDLKNARTARRRRARAREDVMNSSNPRRRKRRSRAREEIVANPRRRRRARRNPTTRAVIPAVVRRRSRRGGAGRARPASVSLTIRTRKPARRRYRRTTSRRRGTTRRRGAARRRAPRRTPVSRRLPPMSREMMLANPIGMYDGDWGSDSMGSEFLENPLTKGEVALAAVTGGVGFIIAELADRYVAVNYNTVQGLSNQQLIDGPPGWKRMGTQAILAVAAFGPTYWIQQPMARAAMQGAGLGVVVHLAAQLIKSYVIGQALSTNATVQNLFPDTIAANAAVAAAVGASGNTGTVAGLPFGLGRAFGIGRASVPYGRVGQVSPIVSSPMATISYATPGNYTAPQSPVSTLINNAGQYSSNPNTPSDGQSWSGNGGNNQMWDGNPLGLTTTPFGTIDPCNQPAGSVPNIPGFPMDGVVASPFGGVGQMPVVASAGTRQEAFANAYGAALDEVCGVNGVPNKKAHVSFPD
jgi:hypothetical protein